MWKVQLFELNFDEREARAVQEVLEGGWITMGPKTAEFEQAFGEMLGEENCTAVSSGTAALHLGVLSLGIGPGAEVIVPALNFVAGANAVRVAGANPVLADCESYENWNVSVDDVRRKIRPETAAVMCVHYAGYPCRMDDLLAVCEENELSLIEDVAHAPGGLYGDRALGTIGDVGCFSFFTNKNLSVGEGGMVVSRHDELHERLRFLRSHGMTTLTLERHRGRAISYDVVQPGLNYRIDEMRAAIGLVQLGKLARANDQRAEIAAGYRERLDGMADVSIPFLGYEPGRNTHHIFPILLRRGLDRNRLIEALKLRGIQASIHYPSLAGFQAYASVAADDTPIASEVSARELTLPLYPTMGMDKVELVCSALADCLKEMTGSKSGVE
jgi:dTDP-4-amino-4,6-dideoxygalactose transaminase